MSVLTYLEKQKLEKAFGMEGGYVLSFSNRSFEEFFREVLSVDICDVKYQLGSGSKANRMRAFWDYAAPKELVSLLESILTGWEIYVSIYTPETKSISDKACITEVSARLKRDYPDCLAHASHTPLSIEDIKFSVALSFPGTHRSYVEKVAQYLINHLGQNRIFYDKDYQADLARPNLDVLLQRIYHDQSELVVVFLAAGYTSSEWCGLEWRAIRNIIKRKKAEQLMFVRLDNAEVEGLFSIDGYLDGSVYGPHQVGEFVLRRCGVLPTYVPKSASTFNDSDLLAKVRDALRIIQRETRFLWLELLELYLPKHSCSSEIKRSTMTKIGDALKFLEDYGYFRLSSSYSYDVATTKEPVFIVTLKDVNSQLVNLARKIEENEPRDNK